MNFKKSFIITNIFLLITAIVLVSTASRQPVVADGGPNDECEDAQATSITTGNGSERSYSTGDANVVVSGVCIKSGSGMFGDSHSESLDNGLYEAGCYEVAGVGTSTVTVKKLLSGSSCKDISHLDVYTRVVEQELTPTPTDVEQPTPTPTDVEQEPTPTPTDVEQEPTPTPTPTDIEREPTPTVIDKNVTPTPTNTPTPTATPTNTPTPTPTGSVLAAEATPTNTPTPTDDPVDPDVLGAATELPETSAGATPWMLYALIFFTVGIATKAFLTLVEQD